MKRFWAATPGNGVMPWFGAVAIGVLLAAGSCSREEGPLDVHRVLERTPEELIERWGEPKQYHPDPQVEGKFGFALWTDVAGVRVFVVITRGKVSWVTYRFENMDPFDEAAAFRIIGVEPPADQARHLPSSPGAKRWEPFEKYQKLTVSPPSRMVAVGKDPLRQIPAESLEEAGAGPDPSGKG